MSCQVYSGQKVHVSRDWYHGKYVRELQIDGRFSLRSHIRVCVRISLQSRSWVREGDTGARKTNLVSLTLRFTLHLQLTTVGSSAN